jgi:hypothetical protein
MWESKSTIFEVIVLSKPFRILKAIINAATPREIPMIEIDEINVMNRESFLDKLYFLEINKEKDIKDLIQ